MDAYWVSPVGKSQILHSCYGQNFPIIVNFPIIIKVSHYDNKDYLNWRIVMKPLVYVFPSCLKGKDGKFSLDKVQMLKGISVKTGTKPIIFWIGKEEQQELDLLLSQVKLDVVKVLPSIRPNKEDTPVVRRKYLNKCLKGVEFYFVISELKSSDERFLSTKELTLAICDKILKDHSNQNKVFIKPKVKRVNGKQVGKQTVKNVLKRSIPLYIDKDSNLVAVPDILFDDE